MRSDNYRPISLITNIFKIIGKIENNKIINYILKKIQKPAGWDNNTKFIKHHKRLLSDH